MTENNNGFLSDVGFPYLVLRIFKYCRGICDMEAVDQSAELKQAQREYAESRILSAQPVAIVEMLYEVAINALENAIRHLKSGDAMARSSEVSRAQEAVNELMLALDRTVGASFTGTLAALYVYVQEQILKGHVRRSEEAFRAALAVLKPLWEGWAELRKREATDKPLQAKTLDEPARETTLTSVSSATGYGSAYQPEIDTLSRDWNC